MKRHTIVSTELYMQIFLNSNVTIDEGGCHCHTEPYIYWRQVSFKSGVITSRSMLNGVPLGEHFATMTSDDFNVDKGEYVREQLKVVTTVERSR